jgi:hypothetical protein
MCFLINKKNMSIFTAVRLLSRIESSHENNIEYDLMWQWHGPCSCGWWVISLCWHHTSQTDSGHFPQLEPASLSTKINSFPQLPTYDCQTCILFKIPSCAKYSTVHSLHKSSHPLIFLRCSTGMAQKNN